MKTLIKISVEPASAFDSLSILEIKKAECKDLNNKNKIAAQIQLLQEEINESIGYELARKIHNSDFYFNLYNANLVVFKQIDKEKSAADILNFQRFLAKNKLQEEFFKKQLEEVKIGYNEEG